MKRILGGASRRTVRSVAVALAVASALALSACSSSGATPAASSAASGDSSAVVAKAKQFVADNMKGNFVPPPTSGPAAQKGKNVWFISCGSQFEACTDEVTYFQDAAKILDWNVTVFDGKGDPTITSEGIRQAIAAKADGIAGFSHDCSGSTSALQAAKAANIPVTFALSEDCDATNSGPALFAANLQFGGYATQKDWTLAWGSAKAQYYIAKTDGQAKIINLNMTDQVPVQEINDGFLQGMQECTTCTILDTVKFTVPDIPAGVISKLQTALIQNPTADAVHVPFDSLMTLGLVPVFQRANRDLIIGGGEGSSANMQLIRDGSQTFALAFPYDWLTWGTADTLNRIFAGQPGVQEGAGFQFVDKDNNLPASGGYEVAYDFKSDYQKIWG